MSGHLIRKTLGEEPDTVGAEAWARVERGDRDGAITVLLRAYGAPIYRYCRNLLGHDADAYDVMQTVFLQAFQGLTAAGPNNVRAWLYGIARHRCLDALRGRRRRRRREDAGDDGDGLATTIADNGPATDARLRAQDAARTLDECLDKLEAEMRTAVLFHYRDQLSYDEIAELTGARAGTLRVRVARALPLLRRCLERKGVGL